ncbi:amidohydrolase family protein [Phycicoccus sp. CSK15P-2]|uniref:metal-dependent hydrolase family protein n=1 Tax=Phycicoccus sp. CSK15P-2 TaxID=2807627 RepID=UPI0019508FCB|nr:amidohydrolase family protein [Phycicoccus sp. CSK15P-2]MBM6406102.1 amidohydrolase family protein [Phycicoccus sp. CSK15P-2]
MRTVVRGGSVFDGTGAAPAVADVAIEGGRIAEVGVGLDGDDQVDAHGLSVLPGLFDCHVHTVVSGGDLAGLAYRPFSYQFFEAARNLRATLDAGITTVRDAAGADLGIKRAAEDGLIDGPRVHIAISALSQTGGHYDGWQPSGLQLTPVLPHPGRPSGVADGPEAVRREAREIIRAGADVLKVCVSGGIMSSRDHPEHAQLRPDELAVIVAEAEAVELKVMAHAHSADGVKAALRAGVRSIEHGTLLDDEAIELMLRSDAWLVPTLLVHDFLQRAATSGAPLPPGAVEKLAWATEAHHDSVARAVAAGVKVAMGTDSGVVPHGNNLDELALLTGVGLSPERALSAATSEAARLLGVADELGTLEPGKRADLVLVHGDALDLADLKPRIRAVYMNGRRVRYAAGDHGRHETDAASP